MASVVAICDYLFEPVVLCDQFLFKEGELFKSSVRKESLLTADRRIGKEGTARKIRVVQKESNRNVCRRPLPQNCRTISENFWLL